MNEETYEIPEDIKKLIDKEFLSLFKDNLDKIFIEGEFSFKDHTYWHHYSMLEMSNGWHTALLSTCLDLHKLDIIRYCEKLEWYDSDMFDGELCLMMVEQDIIEMGEYIDEGDLYIENWGEEDD